MPAQRVRLKNPNRVLFPEDGITKSDLFAYSDAVASAPVPQLRDRSFTMKRYREGIAGAGFFQKQAPKGMPPSRRT
jgi:bifunctional non-homologous end joining protein LigD